MKRFTFLITVPWLVILGGCGSDGETQGGAGGGAGSGGSSTAGGSKSGGSGGTSSGGSKSGGAGSSGSSGGVSSGSGCTLGCAKMAELDCPNDNPETCPQDCAARAEQAHEMYPDCIAEYDATIDCIGAAPISEWICNAMGKSGVGQGNCTEEALALSNCVEGSGGG